MSDGGVASGRRPCQAGGMDSDFMTSPRYRELEPSTPPRALTTSPILAEPSRYLTGIAAGDSPLPSQSPYARNAVYYLGGRPGAGRLGGIGGGGGRGGAGPRAGPRIH